MLLDIVILPPRVIREKIGRSIVNAVKDIPHGLIVDNKKLIPHLSLFHVRTSKKRIKNLASRIRGILNKYRPMRVRRTGYYGGGEEHYFIAFETNRTKSIARLHEEVVFKCYPLRTGAMPSISKKLSKLDKQYRKRYGSQLLLKNFKPHFTLGLLKRKSDIALVGKRLRSVRFNFIADTVAITEVNFWHQVTRVIKKFKLGS